MKEKCMVARVTENSVSEVKEEYHDAEIIGT